VSGIKPTLIDKNAVRHNKSFCVQFQTPSKFQKLFGGLSAPKADQESDVLPTGVKETDMLLLRVHNDERQDQPCPHLMTRMKFGLLSSLKVI